MIRFKKVVRLLILIFLILLALSGVGAIPMVNTREKYMNNEIKIEQVDKRDDEIEDEVKGALE
jgi:hypothetical protein